MRKLVVSLLTIVFAFATLAPDTAAQQRAAVKDSSAGDASVRLPVRRVVLYKNGVGYFEHQGRVRGSQDVTIDFTSAQLNDVLKSLTVLDLSGGRISGVNYNSEAPLSQRLAALRLPVGDAPDVASFLQALRGARLEVSSGAASVSGRLLSVEKKSRTKGEQSEEITLLSLVSDSGELRTVELQPSTTVRLAERDLSEDVGRYLGLLASAREQDLRRLAISTAGNGERSLQVSYISEVPVWKTTYRIVLPSRPGAKPLLQGWAIVDNTVGEDWDDVELALVAGAPQSFIQQLSQPYYVRRPQVGLPQNVMLTPQTHQATLINGYSQLNGQVRDASGNAIPNANVRVLNSSNQVIAQTQANRAGQYTFDDLAAGNYKVEISAPGFNKTVLDDLELRQGTYSANTNLDVGSVNTVVEVEAGQQIIQTQSASVGSELTGRMKQPIPLGGPVGSFQGGIGGGAAGGVLGGRSRNSAAEEFSIGVGGGFGPAAEGQDLGDLFEYTLKDRVTIRKNQSAMVPIIQAEIAAEKVSLWNAALGRSRPLVALWVTNSSNLTLDAGSFNVIESDAFAGEGLVDALKPGERRLLSYAADSAVQVNARSNGGAQRITRVRAFRGVLIQSSEMRESRTYTVRNEDTAPRVVVIEHPARPDWKLAADAPKPEESTAGFHRFRVTVEPKKTATLTVTEVHPMEARYQISNLGNDEIKLFVAQRSINPEAEQALRRVVDKKDAIAEMASQISAKKAAIQEIFTDQSRVRENLKSLRGSAEEKALMERYVKQLADQETKLDALRKEVTSLQAKQAQAQSELNTMIEQLSLDFSLPGPVEKSSE